MREMGLMAIHPGPNLSKRDLQHRVYPYLLRKFWRSLKYNEIYINDYTNPRETRKGVDRYIHLHNHYLPHQSLQNHTPSSVYNRDVVLLSTCE